MLFTALVNGTGAMPDDMMQLLPKVLRDTNAGLEVLQHINQRVCAISEAATAVQEEEFKEQKAVLEHKKHLLASVHAVWKQLRDQLDAKQAPQSAAQQRRSITRMVSKLPEVMGRMEASVAAHKVLHPGTELPVATMELVVEEFASKYSSVSAVEGAYSLQMMEAFDATPEYPGPRDQQHQQQHQQGDRKGIPCKFWKAGTCWRKSKCPWRHDGKPGPPPAEAAPPAYSANVIRKEMDRWLAEKVAGVSALLGVCSQVAEGMIVAALQELQVNNHRASVCLGQHPGVALVVVADTGATVRVIGGADSSRAVNVRLLPRPVPVRGAGGVTLVERMGDLPGCGGLMRDCLMMPECAHSLLPVPLVCEERSWGYQIDQGNTGSRFTAEGETVVQLESQGGMAVLPEGVVGPEPGQGLAQTAQRVQQPEVAGGAAIRGSWEHMWCWPEVEVAPCNSFDSNTRNSCNSFDSNTQNSCNSFDSNTRNSCNSFDSNTQNSCNSFDSNTRNSCNSFDSQPEVAEDSELSDSEVQCAVCEPEEQSLHTVLVAEVAGLVAYGLESRAVSEPSWMAEHERQGHPYRKDCPWCVQGRLRQKQHCRQVAGSGTALAGSTVKVDLTGPYEPGVTGSTWALVGIHEESDWGYVGLQQSKAAAASLVSIQSMEVQLRADSGGKAEPIARFHHDDDKSFRGPVEEYARQRGWEDTHTGGYNPNANAKAEVRIGMLKQRVRVLLLACTGGTLYYEQLWDVALVYCNRLLNVNQWPDRDSPIARLTGMPVPRDKHNHVFGCYCLYHVPRENRTGAFQPPAEMGVWVGSDPHVRGGHWVVPIHWDVEQQAWVLGEVVTATTVRVYERVKPLRMQPKKGQYGSQEFDTFVDKVFNPMLIAADSEVQQPEGAETQVPQSEEAGTGHPETEGESSQPEYSEVESVLNKRVKGGVTQYKVKWKGWNNRYNCWRDQSDLECQELIDKYEEAYLGLSQPEVLQCVMALVLSLGTAGAVADDRVQQAVEVPTQGLHSQLHGLDSAEAVRRLMSRQQLEGQPQEFVPGYEKELQHMLDRRLRLLGPEEEARVRQTSPIVSMRMLLGVKKDGRRKARLILQGFKEPSEWDLGSNVSPVAYPSSVRSLVFMGGEKTDVLSSIDVSVAFLQSEEYGPDETPRYVSYRPYAGAREFVCQLRGPVYGQRSAPREWYKTVTAWMIQMGYKQGRNEPCLFVHPVTAHRVVLFCDDFLCRGSKEVSEQFYAALSERFECKDPSWLSEGSPMTFTGMDIRQFTEGGKVMYSMDQGRDMREFLEAKGLGAEKLRQNPMADKAMLTDTAEISENLQSWCRSVLGGLHYYARGTRYDIAYAVSRVSQTMVAPVRGTVTSIEHIAGYMLQSQDFSLVGEANPGVDNVVAMCDASHRGDRLMTSRSQTGVIICLNGVPVMWRSNRQPVTSLSPAESEIYALSVGVKDVRLMGWVFEEFGIAVRWPMKIWTDSAGAISFSGDTCPVSRIRGAFDYREDWVEELKNQEVIQVCKVKDLFNLADMLTKCYATYKFKARIKQVQGCKNLQIAN